MPEELKELQSYAESLDEITIFDRSVFIKIMDEEDPVEKQTLLRLIRKQAKNLGCARDFNAMYKAHLENAGQALSGGLQRYLDFKDAPLTGLTCGDWVADQYGVRKEVETNNGRQLRTACPHPILPVEIMRNIATGIEKVRIAFFKHGKWKEITVDRDIVANKNKLVDLSKYGVEVNTETARYLMLFFSDVMSANRERIPVKESSNQCGWIGAEQFAPYSENISFDGDKSFLPLYQSISSAGSFEEWKEFCRDLRKNLYLRLQMAASFAAPMLKKIGVLPFVLHLWGGTGSGKTVGLMVAMSIWGNPELGGLVKTMNMTANSMSETAAFLNNIPFAGDELQTIKSRWENSYDSLIMYLTEGVNRSRLQQRGILEQQKTWCCSFLFTGEEPITKSSSGGGVKNRVIEIGLKNDEKIVENGNRAANFVREHYGHAGKVWIEHIAQMDLKPLYQKFFQELLRSRDTTEKQAMAMACMLLADQLASPLFFPGEKPIVISDVSGFLTSAKEVDTAARAYDWTLDWIARNKIRFVDREDGNNGEIWGRLEENMIMINKTVFSDALQKNGFDYTAIIQKFAERGQIERNSQGKYRHQTKVYGIKASYIKLRAAVDAEELDSDLQELLDDR